MLKRARPKLMYPSQTRTAGTGREASVPGVQPSAAARPRQARPTTALVTGPTMPTRSSVAGRSGSRSICDTPPRANRVGADGQAAGASRERVRQLVEDQGGEEQQPGHDGRDPNGRPAPLGLGRPELADQGKDDE